MKGLKDTIEKIKVANSTKLFFTDLNGRLMSLPFNADNIEQIANNGIGFDGSSIAGYTTVDNSDRTLVPALETLNITQFQDETLGSFIGKIYNEKGERAKADPRAVLERVVKEAEEEFGFRFLLGPEHEFFLLSENPTNHRRNGDPTPCTLSPHHSDDAGYFQASPHDKGEVVRSHIISILRECGIRYEKAHHEVTPSQHEINLECTDPISAADRTLLFTYVAQKVAVEHGYYATFMPKPFDNYNRNAFHIHLSIQDKNGTNLFYEEDTKKHLSDMALQFIAGVVKYGRQASIIMASTHNSYKAYVIEREAPVVRGWGFRNRSSMIRVPFTNDAAATRIEFRAPDPSGNVYLQFACLIAMGLQGIREKLSASKPDVGSTYKKKYKVKVLDKNFLPKCLFDALAEAENSAFLRNTLGDRIFENYMALKIADWEEHRINITNRELQKYLRV